MTQIEKRKMTRFEKIAIAVSILVFLAIIVASMMSGAKSLRDSMESTYGQESTDCIQQKQAVDAAGITAENIGDNEQFSKDIKACGIVLPSEGT